MDDIGRKQDQDPPQGDVEEGARALGPGVDRRYFPAWLREDLIAQFQGIDHSTRSEAVLQIEAYERSFMAIFGDGSGGGPTRKCQDLSAFVPPHAKPKGNGHSGT